MVRRKRINRCHCCGYPLPETPVSMEFSGRQRKFYELIYAAGTQGIIGNTLMDMLYDDDPNGGPESRNIINVMTKQVNKRLWKHGVKIVGRRGPGSYFKVVAI